MIAIKTPIISERKFVKAFLIELMEVLQSKDFDIDDDLLIIKSQKEEVRFSTRYTLLATLLAATLLLVESTFAFCFWKRY